MSIKINQELFILIIGRVLQIFIALIAIKLATKFLEATEMGNLYLITSIAVFFGFFLIGPIGQYINRKTHQWYQENNLINMFYIYNYYIICLSFLSIGFVFIFYYFNFTKNLDLLSLVSVLFVYIIAHTWNQTIIPMLNMLEHRISFVVFTLISQLLYLVLSYLFINMFGYQGLYWFLGQAIGFGTIALFSFIYFKKNIQNDFNISKATSMVNRKNIKELWNFSAPLFLSALFFWVQTQSYPLIISKFINVEFVGYFGVGLAVASAISSAFESIVMQYVYPIIYKNMNNEHEFTIIMSNAINIVIPIYFILAIFVSIFAIYINSILVDHKYFGSYIFVIFGIWIAFFRMSSNFISNIAHSKMKTKKLILPNFVGAVLTVFGIILASYFKNYELYVPSSILFASFISYLFVYISMKSLMKIYFEVKIFLFIILYSLPFLLGILFYRYANEILYSVVIVGIFGLYFLFILYEIFKKGQTIG